MAAAVVIPMNSKELETRSQDVVSRANSVQVHDNETYIEACNFLLHVIAPMRREIEETFDPICKKMHEAHREATAQRARHLKPMEAAEGHLKSAIGAFELEQRRLIAEAERLAQEEQVAQLAAMTETAIEEAEAAGASVEEVQAIIMQPLAAPKVVVAPTYNRVSNVTTRKSYRVEVTNMRVLCSAIAEGRVGAKGVVLPDEKGLNAMARAQGPDLARFIPGIRVVEVASVFARRA